MAERTVKVGNGEYKLREFTGYKGIQAAAIVASISEAAEKIVQGDADFRRQYGRDNRQRVPESVAIIQGWPVSDSSWLVDEEGRRYLDLPAVPTEEQRFLRSFPEAFRIARKEMIQLVGLVVCEDRELEAADDEGGDAAVDEFLTKTGRTLVRRASLGELVDLVHAAFETVKEELGSRQGKVHAIRDLFTTRSSRPSSDGQEDGATDRPTPETSSGTEPDSSTSSPEPTDGDGQTSSTESVGASLSG